MIARRMAFAGMLLCSVVLGGCPRRPCPERSVSLVELVDQHNANASRIRKLWARARIRVTLSDESGLRLAWGSTSALAPSNGYVMLSKEPVFSPSGPGPSDRVNFVLIGREMSDLFRLGLDARSGLYYFWYRLGDRGEAWYGRTEYAGAPKAESMPIDPTQLVEILCVTELPQLRPGAMPTVVMTLQSDPCAYVVRYIKPQPVTGHLKIWREVYFRWDDERPRRPFRVKLYDPSGRCRVTAEVGKYKPIEWDGPDDRGPIMPTDIRMTWPAIRNVQNASSIHVILSDVSAVKEDWSQSVFNFWDGLPAVDEHQVDEAYGPIEERPTP